MANLCDVPLLNAWPTFVETNITKIEITTTHAVDVEQLARDIRASIGYCNIIMHAIMTNLCEVPLLRRHGILSGCEVIVHINRAVCETTAETPGETGETEEPPPKRARGDLDA